MTRMLKCKGCGKYHFPLLGNRKPEEQEVDWGGYNEDIFVYRTKFVLTVKCPYCAQRNIWRTLKEF